MRLTWRQFQTYQDAFTFLLQQESEDGQKKNQEADLIAMKEDKDIVEAVKSDRERAKAKLAKIKDMNVGTLIQPKNAESLIQ